MIHQFYQKFRNGLLNRASPCGPASWRTAIEGQPGRGVGPGTGSAWFFSFWPLQIGGWGLMLLVPVLFLVTGSITDPSTLCYGFTRPVNGFLITLALRPCCSWALARFGKHWLLVPVIFLVSLALAHVELMGVDRLVLACGFPAVPRATGVAILEPHGPGSTGLGIANLRKRLHLLYGDQAQLTFDHTANLVRAQVSLPVSGTA